jgi:cytoskeleton protein RodZ
VSIGQTLAEARRAAGLSVDDVSAKTRLRATVIRAIENDDFSLCGGDFYARGHVRTLAHIVGTDPVPLLAEYDAEVAQPDEMSPTARMSETESSGRELTESIRRRRPNWGAAAVAAVLVAIIAVAAAQLLGHSNKTSTNAGAPTPSPSAVTSSSTPTVSTISPTPVETTTQSPPPTTIADAGVHVVLNVTTAKCWVLATASNGTTLFQGILNPGDSKVFDDPQKVSLRLGNAPATDLVVNNVDIGAPSATNNVVDVSFGPGNPTQAQG